LERVGATEVAQASQDATAAHAPVNEPEVPALDKIPVVVFDGGHFIFSLPCAEALCYIMGASPDNGLIANHRRRCQVTQQTNLRLSLKWRQALVDIAEMDRRTLAAEVEWLIDNELIRREMSRPAPQPRHLPGSSRVSADINYGAKGPSRK
jgi:hypothetical protein